MPIDPLHLRRIPSGRRLYAVVRFILRAMLPHARQQVSSGRLPDFRHFDQQFIRAILPIMLHEWQLGRETMAREIRMMRAPVFSRRGGVLLAVKKFEPFTFDWTLLREAVPLSIQHAVLALVGSVTESLRSEIRDRLEVGVREGESNRQIADRLDDLFGPRRAYTIAATESSRGMHAGEEEYARETGAAGLEWLASSDACEEICLKLSGKRVRFGETFLVHRGGNPVYANVFHPPAHPRCMCSTIPWWDE